jgi:hypothetical protein
LKTESKLKVDEAIEIVSAAIGEYAWLVKCADDRILRAEFGPPHLKVHGPWKPDSAGEEIPEALTRRLVIPTGRWSLFVESGLWSAKTRGLRCDRFTPDQRLIDKCLSRLDGQKLVSVAYERQAYNWLFKFDLSGELSIGYLNNPGFPQWTMFFEDGGNLSYDAPDRIVLKRPE